MLERLMGIVTGDASETSVRISPALAVFKPVRRKAGICCADSRETGRHNIFPSTVARAAEIHRRDRIQVLRIHDRLRTRLRRVRLHGSGMGGARSVARLAGDTQRCAAYIKFIFRHGSGCVARKTSPAIFRRHAASRGIFQAARRFGRLPRRNVQSFRRSEKTQMAFVVAAISLVHVCLTHVAHAECPKQLGVDRRRTIVGADRENTLAAFGHNLFTVGTNAKR